MQIGPLIGGRSAGGQHLILQLSSILRISRTRSLHGLKSSPIHRLRLPILPLERKARAEEAHKRILELVADFVNQPEDLIFVLGDQFEQVRKYGLKDGYGHYIVRVSARLLGIDTGRDVLYRAGQQLRLALNHMRETSPPSLSA